MQLFNKNLLELKICSFSDSKSSLPFTFNNEYK